LLVTALRRFLLNWLRHQHLGKHLDEITRKTLHEVAPEPPAD
jgi:hypothetical protein